MPRLMYNTLTTPHDASRLCMINGIFCVNFGWAQKILPHLTILANRGSNRMSSYDLYKNTEDAW